MEIQDLWGILVKLDNQDHLDQQGQQDLRVRRVLWEIQDLWEVQDLVDHQVRMVNLEILAQAVQQGNPDNREPQDQLAPQVYQDPLANQGKQEHRDRMGYKDHLVQLELLDNQDRQVFKVTLGTMARLGLQAR